MKLEDYQKRSYVALQNHESNKDRVLNWVIGLSEEVGEILNLIKHKYWGGEEIEKIEMAKEIGDVLWYLSALASSFSINIGAVAELNVMKLEKRFSEGIFKEEASKERVLKEKILEETKEYKEIVRRLFK